MAYQTGSVANGGALKTTLTSFMTSNGYTLANGWYGKGKSSVKFAHMAETIFYKILSISGNNARLYWGSGYTSDILNISIGDTFKIHSPDINWDQKIGTVYNISPVSPYATSNWLDLNFTSATTLYATAYNSDGTYIERISTAGIEESLVVLSEGDTFYDQTFNISKRCLVWVDAQHWPVTYHMFASDTQISCIIHYAGAKIMPLFIGEIVKVDDNAFVGGEWAWCSAHIERPRVYYPGASLSKESRAFFTPVYVSSVIGATISSTGVPFGGSQYTNVTTWNTRMHCEIDGETWLEGTDPLRGYCTPVQYTHQTLISAYAGFNPYTDQAQLVPIHLQNGMENNLEAYIGYLDHIRMIRVDHYNIGDVITIGSDSWMIFPWCLKNTEQRNGATSPVTYHHSGTLGFAIRYVL